MLRLDLTEFGEGGCRVLCVGAHCDDIEMGCGGTLLKFLDLYDVSCRWIVFSGASQRERECTASAKLYLAAARESQVEVLKFRDGFMPFRGADVKERFEQLKHEVSPDLIFTHYRDDRHQDHRLISDLTWNTFRDHLILEYEIPKYDGDIGRPNVFVPLEERYCRTKIEYLLRCYETQRGRRWFTEDTFRATLRLRGIEAGTNTEFAEAFYGRKLIL